MMNELMGIINTVHEHDGLEELTYSRCVASVPFGGRYRLIDFILSNMVNSGISNVSVFLHRNPRSLLDHLGPGKEWDLDRKRGGLFLLPPSERTRDSSRGDLQAFHDQRDYLYRSHAAYVLLARSHMIGNLDFRPVLLAHKACGADITILYKETPDQDEPCRRLQLGAGGRVTAMYANGSRHRGGKISMEMFLMKKDLLLDIVETALTCGYDDLVRDAIQKNLDRLNVRAFRHDGYLGVLNSLQSYYRCSMELLNPAVRRELFYLPGVIYTKVKDEPPAVYRADANVSHSLIANGCVIEGKVENSILFRGVTVQAGAEVKNSIVLQNGVIREGAVLDRAILDKDVIVQPERTLIGHALAPFVAAKRSVI